MDHLACFTGGMFGLAAAAKGDREGERDLSIGEGIARTCVRAYDSAATGTLLLFVCFLSCTVYIFI